MKRRDLIARAHDLARKYHSAIAEVKCESCNRENDLCLHHDDYEKPLVVRTLCRWCHADWHLENGPGLGGDDFTIEEIERSSIPAKRHNWTKSIGKPFLP